MNKILVIYPGFPHYRVGIIEALTNSPNNHYVFLGDKKGWNNIKPYDFKDSADFKDFPAYKIGPFYFNRGLIRYAFSQKSNGAIVHAPPHWISIIVATLILRIKGVKVFNWTHGILTNHKNLKNRFYFIFFKYFFDGLLLYGNLAKQNLINLGFNKEKIKVIYNSLDYNKQIKLRGTLTEEERQSIRSHLFDNPNNNQLVFIGRLTTQKKLNLLIKAIKLLKDENILVNLLLIGDGDEKERLQAQIDKYKIADQICFYGASYDETQNYKLISSSDCCVATGEIGLTAMHSLMFGVPVISHSDMNKQMPEFEAILPNINGDLFEYDNTVDLKEKIKNVLNFSKDKSDLQVKEDCYKIMDEYYNPDFQSKLIDSLF
ncbi:glycosyltransferase [Flagellimonas sp.]|jgi:glycosyltransferase involved in cell wall biosynthesis|uniref:glycosyltransferase n=1 Tax=Flagellimonas sp. TaxID=2058762 RepID=UPI003BABA63E